MKMKRCIFLIAFAVISISVMGQVSAETHNKYGIAVKNKINAVITQSNANDSRLDGIDLAIAPIANAQTGTTYTFVLTDANKIVTLNSADPIAVTVPPNSSVAFPVGTILDFVQLGAGAVTIGPGSGVTLSVYDSDSIMGGQYAVGSAWQYSADTWLLYGNF